MATPAQTTDAFRPWTATQTTADLIADAQAAAPQITDFTRGSVLRSLYETVGIESQHEAQQVLAGIVNTIQTLFLRAYQITPAAATAAYGTVTFTVTTAPTSAVTLPQGFTVAIPSSTLTYVLQTSATWAAGATSLSAVVTCQTPGSAGNAPAGTITQVVSVVPSGLTGLTVTNPTTFSTGTDAQTADDAMAQVPLKAAQQRTATQTALAAAALTAVVQDVNGNVTEQAAAAVAALGLYLVPPAQALTLSLNTATTSSFASNTTVYVANDFGTAAGRTPLGSSLASIVVTSAGQDVTTAVTFPASGGATSVGIYVGTTATPLLLGTIAPDGTVTYSGSATSGLTVTVSGTTCAITISAAAASNGASPSATNTAWAAQPGYATVWVANSANTPASSALLTQASQAVVGYADAEGVVHPGVVAEGITAGIVAATLVTQDVAAAILPAPGYTLALVQDGVQNAAATFFAGLDVAQGVQWTALLRALLNVPGVADVSLTTPAANVGGAIGQRIILGTVTLTQLS